MQGITPTASAATWPQQPATAAGSTTQAASATSAHSTTALAQSSSSVTLVSQQVGSMLAQIGGGGLDIDAQTLRLLIALLVLQELLGQNGNGSGSRNGNGRNGAIGQPLGMLAGANGSATLATSSSTLIHVQQHHSVAYAHQSFQSQSVGHAQHAQQTGVDVRV